MLDGRWVVTGESGIVDEFGNVRDIQHRAWAAYLSCASFPTFLVTGVPDTAGLSTFINSGHHPRSAAEALYMAGVCANGTATTVAAAIAIAHRYDHRAYGVLRNKVIDRLTNSEVVEYAQEHTDLVDASRTVLSDYAATVKVIENKGISAFVGDRKSTRLNSSHEFVSRMPSSA